MPATRTFAAACAALAIAFVASTLLALPAYAEDSAPAVATPSPVVGPRDLPSAIPHTNVIALPLIANMTAHPPQLAEAAAVYAGQTQFTPGAGVARTITAYSVGTTLFPAGTAPVAQPGTLASPQVDVVVRSVAVQQHAATVASMSAAMIAYGPSLMPGTAPTTLVVVAQPPVAIPPSVVAKTDTPIVAPSASTVALPVAVPTATPQSPAGWAQAQPAAQESAVAAEKVLPGEEDVVCNAFGMRNQWASVLSVTDVWTDWYGGWAPFAVDDGFRQAKNTTFSLERVIGPGKNYGSGYSVKIASNQPYAGGFGSPILHVRPGATVTVRVKYLLWDYIQNPDEARRVMDWASMGVKPDAHGSDAVYVNGYERGQWAQMSNSVIAGDSGEIMVLIQGESAGAVNSNIYFDDVQIFVDGTALASCVYAE